MSRQWPLDARYEGGDSSRTNVQMPSPSRSGRLERPIERFCSEQQRHEKIALMMSEGRDEAHTLRHMYGLRSRASPEDYCSHHDHVSAMEDFASGPSPHGRPPSPPFQPYLEVDGNGNLEGEEEYGEHDSHFEAIRIAARIK